MFTGRLKCNIVCYNPPAPKSGTASAGVVAFSGSTPQKEAPCCGKLHILHIGISAQNRSNAPNSIQHVCTLARIGADWLTVPQLAPIWPQLGPNVDPLRNLAAKFDPSQFSALCPILGAGGSRRKAT